MFPGITRVDKLGCGVVIVIGLVAALQAESNVGAGAGILTAIAAGLILPFAGTVFALSAIEAGDAGSSYCGRSSLSFRGSFDQSNEDDDSSTCM